VHQQQALFAENKAEAMLVIAQPVQSVTVNNAQSFHHSFKHCSGNLGADDTPTSAERKGTAMLNDGGKTNGQDAAAYAVSFHSLHCTKWELATVNSTVASCQKAAMSDGAWDSGGQPSPAPSGGRPAIGTPGS
jgi:hypothetical protein